MDQSNPLNRLSSVTSFVLSLSIDKRDRYTNRDQIAERGEDTALGHLLSRCPRWQAMEGHSTTQYGEDDPSPLGQVCGRGSAQYVAAQYVAEGLEYEEDDLVVVTGAVTMAPLVLTTHQRPPKWLMPSPFMSPGAVSLAKV